MQADCTDPLQKPLKKKTSTKMCKRKSNSKLQPAENSKEENSGLIEMIEESRKKRQHFLKLLIDTECTAIDRERKCKTPTNRMPKAPITPTL